MVNHDRGPVRKFLMDFFSDEELANLCFDYFPLVYNEFTTGMQKSQKARLLVEACQRNGRMTDLLAAMERERPNLYHDHFVTAPPAPSPTFQPTERSPRQIFISHARQDADFAYRLANDLKAHGYAVWMAPDSIQPGEKWVEAINRGLEESGIFVLVMTLDAVASRWVRTETNVAIGMEHRGELHFLPLELKKVTVPPLWQGYQWISFRDDYKKGLENLLEALQPDETAWLSQLYRQLQEAVGRNDWVKAQTLGEKILDQYPDYRETRQLIAQAREEMKRQELLREEAAQLYQRLQAAIAAEAWDNASILIAQIQERVQNYRDVNKLAAMVQQKRRQQRRRAWTKHLANLKRLPAWSWVLMLVPLALLSLLLWAVGDDGDSGRERPTVTATAPTPSRTPSPTWTRPLDRMVMVYVPPPDEPFVLASGLDAPQEGYWIDKYEVSNAQYQLCVDAGECEPSLRADVESFNGADYPVVGVSWFDATDYSAWVGGELPTEEEWEYAAVGDSGMNYPWGNEASCELANYFGCVGSTTKVYSYPRGASWVGALNMAGNVWEWTSSWSDERQTRRMLLGGSWFNDQSFARAASRAQPGLSYGLDDGFRVVVRRPPPP